jgi:hypothetical protein
MQERRDDARRRVYLGGSIETAAFLPEIPCTVRNVSLTGARITVAPGAILPQRLVLRVPMRDEQRIARLVWRDGDAAGLVFEDRAGRTKAEDDPARLRAALAERGDGPLH